MSTLGPGDKPPATRVVPVKAHTRTVVVKPPAGDVTSSGGDYGMQQAKQAAARNPVVKRNTAAVYAAQPVAQRQAIVKHATGPTARVVADVHEQRRLRAEELVHAQAAHDIMTAQDKKTADTFNAAHPTYAKVVPVAKMRESRAAGGPLGQLTGLNVNKALNNIPKDALELAATTPSSVAKIASTAVTHPLKMPGLLAEPYKQLIKDPKGFIESHPVSTALMLSPAARFPGRLAGRAARLTGKQTLARPTATLPGTALRETRVGSKDFTIRAMQARKDAKTPAPVMTAKQIQKQVDETYAQGKTHAGRVEASAYKEGKRRFKALPKAERQAAIQNHLEGARGGAHSQSAQKYAQQFGATAYRTPDGVLIKPKAATAGVLHASKGDAQAVATALNRKAPTVQRGTRLYGKEQVPNEFVVRDAGEKFAVLPKVAADRMMKQQKVGSSKATMAKVLRQSRGMFTRTVLPYRPTWLSGQGIEGVVRSAVAGAGPTSYLRAKKVVGAMENIKPGSGKALLERAAPGGLVGRTAGMEMAATKTLHAEFPESTVARALTDVGRAPGIKQVRGLHHAISDFVFQKLNAKTLEGIPQTMMLGKALKDSPLMERSIIGLSDKAIQDAAKGLQGTEHQVAAARAVERMYGKYAGFSPKQREIIMHWTPFLPWYLNTAQFLLSVLPKDHPVAAAIAADSGAATEEWRKAQGLSTRGGQMLPTFMLGGYPTQGGKSIARLGHYTPFGVGSDITNAVGSLPLPQFSGFYNALSGFDWKGHALKHADGTPFNQGEKWLYGLTQLGQSFVPLESQTQAVLSAKDKGKALRQQFRLISSTPSNRPVLKGPPGTPPPPSAGGSGPSLPVAPPPPKP